MIYAALKNFDRALYFFEVAITTPAMAVSHVMLEAYKKYILVSLILHGKVIVHIWKINLVCKYNHFSTSFYFYKNCNVIFTITLNVTFI